MVAKGEREGRRVWRKCDGEKCLRETRTAAGWCAGPTERLPLNAVSMKRKP